jgi:hypothetical protein
MNTLHTLLARIVVLMLAVLPLSPVAAQTDPETTPVPTLYQEPMSDDATTTDIVEDATGTVDTEEATSTDDVVGTDMNGDLTAGDYATLIEQTETVTPEQLDTMEVLQGEIVAVNSEEGTVVIQTPEGELLTVDQQITGTITRLGGGPVRNLVPGDTVVVTAPTVTISNGVVSIEHTGSDGTKNVLIFLVTDQGRTEVSTAAAPVYRDGKQSSLAALATNDTIQVAQDESGNVVGVYASSTAEKPEGAMTSDTTTPTSSNAIWYWIVGLLVLAALAVPFVFRKRE